MSKTFDEIERIVLLAPAGELGGAERCLIDTIWSIHRANPGIDLHLIAGADGPLLEAARLSGATTSCRPLPARVKALGDSGLGRSVWKRLRVLARMIPAIPAMLGYVRRLKQDIQENQPDVVHVLGLKMQLLSLVAVPSGIPIVWNIQDYLGHRRMISRMMQACVRLLGRRRAIGVGCCSKDVVRDFQRLFSPGQFRAIETVYNTVDMEMYQPDGARSELDETGKDGLKVGLIATYARWKGQDVFIKAVKLLKRHSEEGSTDWHAFIIGGPIYETAGSQWSREELEKLIETEGVRDCVTLVPFQKDAATVMRGLDVVVHASRQPEPFGRVIAEAQACSRAVIAVGSGGSGEVFEDERTGLAIRANDPECLARAIERLFRDEQLRERLSEAGRGFVGERFNRKELAKAWARVYEAVLRD